MIVGVLLRSLGWPLKLVFTSAAQRHHSWITRWLIRRMDAIIATSDISASLSQARGDRDSAWRRYRSLRAAGRSRGGVRGSADCRAAMPSAASAGCARKRAPTSFVDAMCRLLPRYPDFTAVIVGAITPEQTAFANDLKKRIAGGGPAVAHRHHRRTADRGGAALVSAADDLRLHLAQRRFWADADRGDGGRARRWWRRARARPNSWSRTASPAC